MLALARLRCCRDMVEEILLHPLLREKRMLLWQVGMCAIV